MADQKIAIKLEGNIAQFQTAMNQASGIVKGASAQMASSFSGITGIFAGITAALAGGAMFKDMINTTKEVVGEVVKLSKVFGITAEQASVMRVAIDDALLTTDQVVAASDRLTRASIKNSAAFEAAGIQTKDSNGKLKDSMTIMMEVNDYLKSLKEGKDRDTAAMALYGKGWRELSGILRLNTQGMEEAKERAEKLHLIVGEDGVAQVKKYKMAMKDLDDVAESFKYTIGSEMIKVLTSFGTSLGEVGADGADIFAKSFRESLGFLDDYRIKVNDFIMRFSALYDHGGLIGLITSGKNRAAYKQDLKNLDEVFNKSMEVSRSLFGDAVKPKNYKKGSGGDAPNFDKDAKDKTEQFNTSWKSMQDKIRELNPYVDEYTKSLTKMENEYSTLISKFPEHTDELEKNKQVYKSWLDYIRDTKGAITATSSEFKDLFEQWDNAPAAPEFRNFFTDEEVKQEHATAAKFRGIGFARSGLQMTDPMEILKQQYDQERIASEEHLQEMEDLNEKYLQDQMTLTDEYRLEIEKRKLIDDTYAANKQKISDSANAANLNSLESSMNQASNLMMQGGKRQFEVGKNIAKMMIAIDTAKAASAAFAGAAQAGGPWGVALGIGAAVAAMGVGTANMARLDAVQYQAREKGGPVTAGQSYIVGERRPELFTPGASGTITPYVPQGGNAVTTTHVWQISTGVSETVRAEIARLLPLIEQRTVAAVRSAINSGGDMSAAVGRI